MTRRAIDYCRLQQRSAASEQNKERSATSYAQPLVLCPKRRCRARKSSRLPFPKGRCTYWSITMPRPERCLLISRIRNIPTVYQGDEMASPDLGIYRLEVTPEGTVSAITLLKNANRMMDVISMKTFVHWRAKPGPPRVIDVFISFGSRWLGPSSPMHPPS